MRKEEIRVGNLILGVSDRVETVIAILTDMVMTVIPNHGTSFNNDLEDLKAIEIDNTWLVKSGFASNGFGWVNGRVALKTMQLHGGIYVYYYDAIEIKHVHQLQNLYFALTNQELIFKLSPTL